MDRKRWHFIGICGIGMSGLAQFARALGYAVSGSDRSLANPENTALAVALAGQGIELFPQDGSAFVSGRPRPDAVVYSSAIEEDNPDFAAAGSTLRIHRAAALRELILEVSQTERITIAVAGSCGKTSTTAMLGEALETLQLDPCCIDGGMVKAFSGKDYPGNFRMGNGPLVFEADESDKSLLAFHPDYAVVLNVGTDHYEKSELLEMFGTFVNQAKRGAVLEESVYRNLQRSLRSDLEIRTFVCNIPYHAANGRSFAEFDGREYQLPAPGKHTAWNVLAAVEVLKLMNAVPESALSAVLDFHGVKRRFDLAGRTSHGAAVYDDYAHNPEKIATCLRAAQELTGKAGRLLACFQPHGYGPFKFMREELGKILHETLRKQDRMLLMEPYYAGGTSSFSPHADEVLAQWREAYPELPVCLGESREVAEKVFRQAGSEDVILIMGARDNTLSEWAEKISRTI